MIQRQPYMRTAQAVPSTRAMGCVLLHCCLRLPILVSNTPAKPMWASALTLKSCGFFMPTPSSRAAFAHWEAA